MQCSGDRRVPRQPSIRALYTENNNHEICALLSVSASCDYGQRAERCANDALTPSAAAAAAPWRLCHVTDNNRP